MSRRDPFAPFFSVDGVPWWERVRWWAWVLIVAYVVFYAHHAATHLYYLKQIRIPPFEQLQRTEGEVFFAPVSTGKRSSGYLLGLKTAQGKRLFSCSEGPGDGPDCVYVTLVKELKGKHGVIWWFDMTTGPGETQAHPLRIDIDGKTIVSYEKGVWYVEQGIPRVKFDITMLGFLMLLVTYCTLHLGIKTHV